VYIFNFYNGLLVIFKPVYPDVECELIKIFSLLDFFGLDKRFWFYF